MCLVFISIRVLVGAASGFTQSTLIAYCSKGVFPYLQLEKGSVQLSDPTEYSSFGHFVCYDRLVFHQIGRLP